MYIRVDVIPNAKKEYVTTVGENRYEISVRAKPERGLANARVVEVMAAYLGVPPGKVRIISGHHSPRKMLSIRTDEP